MSVKVDLGQLAEALADFGFAYLITVSDDHHAHTVAVDPVLTDGVLVIGPVGNSSHRNVCAHDGVTVVYPPAEPGGYTLIVDGTGDLADDALRVVPERAVLHRRAAESNDCVPLEG